MNVIGSGGGGDEGGGGVTEEPDSLSSVAIARVVDLIAEGPIEGLVNGEFSIYLDGVPLRDLLGTANYQPFTWEATLGTQDQQPIKGFSGTEAETGVGIRIFKSMGKVIRTVADASADAVRVTVSVNGLSETTTEGKIQGATVAYIIWARVSAGAWSKVYEGAITGKTGSHYQRAHEVRMAGLGAGPYEIAVERVTDESESALLVNALYWDTYTVINYELFSYPNSALVAVSVDGRYFSRLPKREYHLKGLIVRVPTNYNPVTREYATTGPGTTGGGWDGTWKNAWTNNPAWCFYDLVTNPRYGLGSRISDSQISKWEMYQIAKYCDELVPSGLSTNVFDYKNDGGLSSDGSPRAPVPKAVGSYEPRFTLNVVINTRNDAYKVLNQLSSVFRGMSYWSSGMVMLTQDRPTAPSWDFTNANALDGVFEYEGSGRAQRHTVAIVGWNDPSEGFTQKFEYVEDRMGIDRYGVRPIELVAFGCTSRGQARRVGLWLLYTERVEKGTVKFKLGMEGSRVRPGDVGKLMDSFRAGARWGGRIVAATSTSVTMDAPLELAAGTYQVTVVLKDGALAERSVVIASTGTYTTLNTTTAFPDVPANMAIWTLSSPSLEERLVRVVSVRPEGKNVFEVVALEHEPSKYAAIEEGLEIEEHNHTVLDLSGVYKVSNLIAEESTHRPEHDVDVQVSVVISWDPPANAPVRGYNFRAVNSSGEVYSVKETSDTSLTFNNVPVDIYKIDVRVVDVLGRVGPPVSITVNVDGIDENPPPNVTGFEGVVVESGVKIFWNPCTVTDYAETELRVGDDWETGGLLFVGKANYWIALNPPAGVYTLWAKHRDFAGNESPDATELIYEVTISTGGTLLLQVDRFPFFSFPSATSHTAQAPGDTMLTFTVKFRDLAGAAAFTAEAFDNRTGGASLGTFTLGGTGNTRTMTAAQFVSLGTSGSVKRVRVTASLGSATDFIDIFRQDPTTTDPYLFLSNPTHSVATDENGLYGDFSDAQTDAVVFEGITDTTDDYTFSIAPDAGVTATINGGAGPVANPVTVTVAVTDMTIPTGITLITASKTGVTLTAEFIVEKQEASTSGYTVVWSPRAEILLPVTDAGQVSSYESAWSELKIIRNGAVDDTANWSLTKEDINVTSTLVGSKVTVTAFLALGDLAASETVATLDYVGADWRWLFNVYYGGGVWIAVGIAKTTGSQTTQYIFRSEDFEAWTRIDVGVAATWSYAAYDPGTNAWVLVRTGDASNANLVRRSTDGGVTWSGVTLSTPATTQLNGFVAGNGRLITCPVSATAASVSTNGGASWSNLTIPSGGVSGNDGGALWYGAGIWLLLNNSGVVHISTNNGGSWTNDNTNWPTDPWQAIEYKGRLVVSLWASATTAKYRDPGGDWVTVALPANIQEGQLLIVSDVLYMKDRSGADVVYTTDGKTWLLADTTSSNQFVRSGASIPVDFLPMFELGGGAVRRAPLLATSDTDGAVIVTAVKAGAADIEAVLPVLKGTAPRDTYAFSAQPGYLTLQATSDGVVTSFANAVFNLFAQKNGVDDTANWTWTWTTTNLTPSSGTGSTITLTGMSNSQDVGYVNITYSKAGQAVRTAQLHVQKVKGDVPSGPRVGGAFAAVTTTTTHIALRFNLDGRVQQQNTSGGPWLDLTTWAGRVHATENQSYWLKVIPDPGTHALTSGTENTFLAMTSNRDFVMSDASPAPHTYRFTVVFATSGGGADPIIGFGSMTILPP